MSTIKVNKIEKRSGSTLELGGACTAVTLACGATQTGFGRTGTVDWCTTAKTSPFTSENGKGYFVNTTSGSVTITLPSSPNAGDIVAVNDYARTFGCNSAVLCRNGSKMCGQCFNTSLGETGQSITLVYVDGTKGWKSVNDDNVGTLGSSFIVASGGTVTTSGNFKIHTFTGATGNFYSLCKHQIQLVQRQLDVFVCGCRRWRRAEHGSSKFKYWRCSRRCWRRL